MTGVRRRSWWAKIVLISMGDNRLASLGSPQRSAVQSSPQRRHPAGTVPQSVGMIELGGVVGDASQRADCYAVRELSVGWVLLGDVGRQRVQQLGGPLDRAACARTGPDPENHALERHRHTQRCGLGCRRLGEADLRFGRGV